MGLRIGVLVVSVVTLWASVAAAQEAPQLVARWPTPYAPFGIAVAPDYSVYAVLPDINRVQHFSPEGTLLGQWGAPRCRGITVDSGGNVYTTGDGQVFKFTETGALLWAAPVADPHGGVLGVTTGLDDTVFVISDYGVVKVTPQGQTVQYWGTSGSFPGQLLHPWGIAADVEGNLYVADEGNARIAKFSPTGVVLDNWYLSSTRTGIHVSRDGVVYVTGCGDNLIQRFTTSGTPLGQWALDLKCPLDLADDAGGTLYFADTEHSEIRKFVYLPVPTRRLSWSDLKLRYR